MYEIKNDKPVPEDNLGRSAKYPFHEMSVGDYFDVTGDASTLLRAKMAAYKHGHRHNKRFTCRIYSDTVTIWRKE